MSLFRFRGRYGRLVILAVVLAGLYYLSPRLSSGSRSSFSISAASVVQWSQRSNNYGHPSFDEPERPRPKLPTPPLTAKHKTRNGRPPRYGPDASARRSGAQTSQPSTGKLGSVPSHQDVKVVSHTEPEPKKAGNHPTPPPPPPDLQLPDSPDFHDPLEHQFNSWKPEDYNPRPRPSRKPSSPHQSSAPNSNIPDPFPLLSRNPPPTRKELNLPETPRHPKPSGPETPLLIGFTRNWPQLLQCIVSYLAVGWPAGDIYVVENTGVMYANRDGRLGLQNPFYANHTQLGMLGVNVIVVSAVLL